MTKMSWHEFSGMVGLAERDYGLCVDLCHWTNTFGQTASTMQNGRQFFVPEARLVLGFALHFTCQNRFHERHQNARKGRWFRVCCEVVGGLGIGSVWSPVANFAAREQAFFTQRVGVTQ
ncbi:MAG: hypothetical protein FWH27_09800 [Planctomycetaceae bacterium]|nr:hypothetical protein [Planctomycetaceae bacterium]